MKRNCLIRRAAVFATIFIVLWGFHALHRASPPKLSILFTGYRDSGGNRMAVFRATNSSGQPYSFVGPTSTEPSHFSYRVAVGGRWHEAFPENYPGRVAWQTLAPHSSMEFTTPLPTAKNGRWSGIPLPEDGSDSFPHPSGAAFCVVINFMPGDGATVQANKATNWMAFKDQARIKAVRMLREGYSFIGFHSDTAGQLLQSWDYGLGERIVSSPAAIE